MAIPSFIKKKIDDSKASSSSSSESSDSSSSDSTDSSSTAKNPLLAWAKKKKVAGK